MLCALWTIIDGDVADPRTAERAPPVWPCRRGFRVRLICRVRGVSVAPRITVLLANAPRASRPAKAGSVLREGGQPVAFSIEKALDEPCRYVPFPFGLAYLAALLERDGVDVAVFTTGRSQYLGRSAVGLRRPEPAAGRVHGDHDPDRGARLRCAARSRLARACSLL